VEGLVVLGRPHLEDGVVTDRRNERVAALGERRAELYSPLGGNLARRRGQRRETPLIRGYFATSTARDSRITITLTWPGYSSWSSICLAIS
jgi:hypothetical protein